MMDRFEIHGGRELHGEVVCAGSKNGTLPHMAAAILAEGVTTLEGVPDLSDIHMMAMVLRVTGADVRFEGDRMKIDCYHCNFWEAPYELVRKMRASFYVLGPLIARFGQAKVSLPGGCNLGPRPVDLHLKALEKLGCRIEIEAGYIKATGKKLKGAEIVFDVASVGATGNIMMAATAAVGETTLQNAACEPEIKDLADMLNAMGADIQGGGTSTITIKGPSELKPVSWNIIPDRIEAATLLTAGVITKSKIKLLKCNPAHLGAYLRKLEEAEVAINASDGAVEIDARQGYKAVDISAAAYPGFPTDLQAVWAAAMTVADGSCSITDSIYPERFNHVPELVRMGANISKKLNTAYIKGVAGLSGTSIMCSDIRAAAAIVLAAVAAEGESSVLRVYHLDRGYNRLDEKLTSLGAVIRRVKE